ncbi:MAG: TRAP transporter small permease subunit [Proteobacteria bacterium]|nr:TRAP transporter small permease subunit [Pseudomonadota bacterium]
MTIAKSIAGAIDHFIDRVGSIISWLAMVVALVMGANVLLRYGFSIGAIWAQELEWYLLAPLTLFGMSYALRHGEHVRVDVLFASFPPRLKLAVDVASAIIAMIFSALVVYLSIAFVEQSWAMREGSPNPGGINAVYLMKTFIPIGFILLFMQSLAQAIHAALGLAAFSPDDVAAKDHL